MWQRNELRTLSSVLRGRVRSQGDQKPAITIHPKSDRWEDRVAARDYTNSQLEVWDFISGRLRPELGGRPDYLDIVGVNLLRSQSVHRWRHLDRGGSSPVLPAPPYPAQHLCPVWATDVYC